MSDKKKSWREIDRSRDSSRHRDDRRPSKREDNASASYKCDLEKFFKSGGDVPERFKGLASELEPEEGTPEAEWREAVNRLRDADGFRELVAEASAFVREGHRLPDDEDLLKRLLDHPNERVVQATLEKFHAIHQRRGIDRPGPLANRLRTIRSVAEEQKTLELLRNLEDALS